MPVNITSKTRNELKGYFLRGARPTAAQFGELIDAAVNTKDDGISKSSNGPLQIQAESGANTLQRVIEFYKSFADTNPAWSLQLNTNQNQGAPGLDIKSENKSRLFIEEVGQGKIGIGTPKPMLSLDVRTPSPLWNRPSSGVVYNDNNYLFMLGDKNHALIWNSGSPLRFGVSDSSIGTAGTSWMEYLRIHNGGLVFSGHDKSWVDIAGISDASGNASIFNDPKDYNALMILGRRRSDKPGTDQRRAVRLWDYLEVNPHFTAPNDPYAFRVNGHAHINNGNLQVEGAIFAGNSDIYFTNTNHNHTGIGNTVGYAALENAKNYDALMILGRAGTPQGRKVRLWDYLEVVGTFVNNSDFNNKKDIEDLPYGLDELRQLRPVSFNWKSIPNPHKSLGLIAQEVNPIIDEIVYQGTNLEGKPEYSISYVGLIPILINAVKELDKKLEVLLSGRTV